MTEPDLVDEAAWDFLRAGVLAANKGDRDAFVAVAHDSPRLGLVTLRLAGLYLAYLLKHRIRVVCAKREPTADDLASIAKPLSDRYRTLLQNAARPDLLAETMRSIFKIATPGTEVEGGLFQYSGTAVLGMLVDDIAGFDGLRPVLAVWCAAKHEAITALIRENF